MTKIERRSLHGSIDCNNSSNNNAVGIGKLILMITMLVIICRTMASKNEQIVKYRAPIVIVAFIALFKISMLE